MRGRSARGNHNRRYEGNKNGHISTFSFPYSRTMYNVWTYGQFLKSGGRCGMFLWPIEKINMGIDIGCKIQGCTKCLAPKKTTWYHLHRVHEDVSQHTHVHKRWRESDETIRWRCIPTWWSSLTHSKLWSNNIQQKQVMVNQDAKKHEGGQVGMVTGRVRAGFCPPTPKTWRGCDFTPSPPRPRHAYKIL